MQTSQQHADTALQQWQQLRNAGLTPQQRIERLVSEFFAPPINLDVKYEDQLRAVTMEMAE